MAEPGDGLMWAWLKRWRSTERELVRLRGEVHRLRQVLPAVDSVDSRKLAADLDEILAGGRLPPVAGKAFWLAHPTPPLGETELLVCGECECGWRCACPEGWLWPSCPSCGALVLPPRCDGPDLLLRRAYVAQLLSEEEAVRRVLDLRAHS